MRIIFFLLICISLTGCSKPQPPPTIEETVLMNGFTHFVSALTYDEVCNKTDPKSRYDFSKPENVMLQGNQQMLTARLGGLWHMRMPDKSVKEGVDALLKVQKTVQEKTKEMLTSKGCDFEGAKAAAKMYEMFTKGHPALVMSILDKQIIKQGGKITSQEEINAVDKSLHSADSQK